MSDILKIYIFIFLYFYSSFLSDFDFLGWDVELTIAFILTVIWIFVIFRISMTFFVDFFTLPIRELYWNIILVLEQRLVVIQELIVNWFYTVSYSNLSSLIFDGMLNFSNTWYSMFYKTTLNSWFNLKAVLYFLFKKDNRFNISIINKIIKKIVYVSKNI